jgi:solute:Na+ symporter, SSS family
MPVVALIAVVFTLPGGQTIVLLMMGYGFVNQLFPAYPRNRLTARRLSPARAGGHRADER